MNQYHNNGNGKSALTAKAYFKLISYILDNYAVFLYFRVLVTQQKNLEQCLNQSIQLNFIDPMSIRKSKVYTYFNYLFFFAFSMLPLLFSQNLFDSALVAPNTAIFRSYVEKGRIRFFVEGSFTEYTAGNVILGIIEVAATICGYQMGWVHSTFFTSPFPVVFWLTVKDFERYADRQLGSVNRNTLWEIKEKYEAVKGFGATVNRVWSRVALVWILDNLLQAMMLLNVLVGSRNLKNVANTIWWVVCLVAVLFMSGETYKMVIVLI